MISVHETEKLSLQQIEKFLAAAKEVRFEASERKTLTAVQTLAFYTREASAARAASF
jgi:hypothetical protein